MEYADLTFYKTEYLKGRTSIIDDTSFAFYAEKASAVIDRYTFGRITAVDENVKKCCCELAEQIFINDKQLASSSGKSSESIGAWSVSYQSSETQQAQFDKKIKSIVYMWLADSGNLFQGV